jgi:hypothetical protein
MSTINRSLKHTRVEKTSVDIFFRLNSVSIALAYFVLDELFHAEYLTKPILPAQMQPGESRSRGPDLRPRFY